MPVANPKLSLLLVDDNVDEAEILKLFLSIMGDQVTLAHTASAALELIKSFSPDVCILDIGLPDSSGHDLAMNIRKVSFAQPILVALTGYRTARDRDEAVKAGFDHYFIKPAGLDALCKVLTKVRPRNELAAHGFYYPFFLDAHWSGYAITVNPSPNPAHAGLTPEQIAADSRACFEEVVAAAAAVEAEATVALAAEIAATVARYTAAPLPRLLLKFG